ncbi:hypothetical protein GALMADRAFT_254365 [Galerina marginata CBS 339.88]|uniref:Uncharacterized protein n=1 Tax=Galerina marginata (strain CBS 339.88) TaxID=685588 RepID=A0A067SJL4_GALM3|nr:hypothetical protein GALMADRAFT_254365 [Galerina marginata CBS 339.88]
MSNPLFGKRPHIAALLIDISGTLHIGRNPTPGAVKAFHRLGELSIPFRLCSNTSKESSASLIKRLGSMGFNILDTSGSTRGTSDAGDKAGSQRLVWTSIGAVAQVIMDMGLKEPFLLLSDSARQEVIDMLQSRKAARDTDSSGPRYDSVVIGLAPGSFDYSHLNAAFRVLKGENIPDLEVGSSKGLPLIATHKAKYIQTEDGLSLGPGPFVAALEHASGVTAHVVGKPTKDFFQMVINDFGGQIPKQNINGSGRIAMIGDDVESDLGGGALELGLWRILVKTGKYRTGDEKRAGLVPPDEVFESFAGFVDSLSLSQKDRMQD